MQTKVLWLRPNFNQVNLKEELKLNEETILAFQDLLLETRGWCPSLVDMNFSTLNRQMKQCKRSLL